MVNCREGRRGPLWHERAHSYPMDEPKGLESFMKSKVSVFSVYYLRSDPIDASFRSISGQKDNKNRPKDSQVTIRPGRRS
jgi:hypothetical protein